MSNVNGNPASLVAAHPGNVSAVRHGVYSERVREPRAREIAEQVMQAPWVSPVDELGAAELGRLVALIESLDAAIEAGGVIGKGDRVRSVVDMRLRASRRLSEWLDKYGLTPHARAHWVSTLTHGTLGERIAARIREIEERDER